MECDEVGSGRRGVDGLVSCYSGGGVVDVREGDGFGGREGKGGGGVLRCNLQCVETVGSVVPRSAHVFALVELLGSVTTSTVQL